MFQRTRHNAIHTALNLLDGALFKKAGCYFGGGTAIVLALGEYRESIDIDFMCASQDGYRLLRQATWGVGFPALLRSGAKLETLRDLRTDQYGIRTLLRVEGVQIKFEIVREARIELEGETDAQLGIPVLSRTDMYAEKLLANADRWYDKSVLSRDIIDLSMMISRWGAIPQPALDKARAAYGDTIDQAFSGAVALIQDQTWLDTCLHQMAMAPALAREITAAHA